MKHLKQTALLVALVAAASIGSSCGDATGDGAGGSNAGGGSSASRGSSTSSVIVDPACFGGELGCSCPGGGEGFSMCLGNGWGPCDCGSVTTSSSLVTSSTSSGAGGAGGASAATSAGTGGGGASVSSAASGGASATSTTGAGGSIACAGGPTEIDLHGVTIYSNPPDLADWPVTTTLTEVDFTNDGVHVEFSKLDGPNRWPDVTPPGWDGPLEYTLGIVECIDGQWYTSAVIEFWNGLYAEGGNVATMNQLEANWYYDAGRWGLLSTHQPATGETIGVFVAAGNLRSITTDDTLQSPVMERSNVVLVPMPDASGATHSF